MPYDRITSKFPTCTTFLSPWQQESKLSMGINLVNRAETELKWRSPLMQVDQTLNSVKSKAQFSKGK